MKSYKETPSEVCSLRVFAGQEVHSSRPKKTEIFFRRAEDNQFISVKPRKTKIFRGFEAF